MMINKLSSSLIVKKSVVAREDTFCFGELDLSQKLEVEVSRGANNK